MAYNWNNKSSEKHEFQKVLFEYYFSPLKLTKSNLKTIKKQKDKNKENYEKLFDLYHHDDCLPTAFKVNNNVLVKYLMDIPEKYKNNTEYSSNIMMTKVCNCSRCKGNMGCLSKNIHPFLFMAADYGNREIVEWLITDKKLDIHYIDENDENILFYSAHLKDLTFIKWLIEEKKINYNHVTKKNKKNLLHNACYFDNLELVIYLLDELKFDINSKNYMGQTCIYYCCHSKTTRALDYLTSRFSYDLKSITDNFDLTIMHNSRNEVFLEHIIKHYNFNINDYNPKKQNHLIFYAASFQNTNLIDYILKNSDITLYNVDKYQNSILYHSVVLQHNFKFSKNLIEKYKLNVNYQNSKGHNILFSAISNYNYSAAKWIILNTDIDVFQKEKKGYDIINDLIHYFDEDSDQYFDEFKDFMKFIFKNTKLKFEPKYMFDICSDKHDPNVNIKILKFILETFKPDINYIDKYGENLLIKAISFKIDVDFIKYLINLNLIDLYHKDKKGKDAFYHCYQHEHGSDITYLIHHKKNYAHFKMLEQLQLVKTKYGNLLRSKQEIEQYSPKNVLEDSGTDFSFDEFNLTNQDKINLFDDLLAYTTRLKLQVLTLDQEPMPCKSEQINKLV